MGMCGGATGGILGAELVAICGGATGGILGAELVGICGRALGAKQTDITVQFLVEALILCLIGALILGIGYFVSGFPLVKNYSLHNAKLLLKSSVIYLPALFLIIILDKLT